MPELSKKVLRNFCMVVVEAPKFKKTWSTCIISGTTGKRTKMLGKRWCLSNTFVLFKVQKGLNKHLLPNKWGVHSEHSGTLNHNLNKKTLVLFMHVYIKFLRRRLVVGNFKTNTFIKHAPQIGNHVSFLQVSFGVNKPPPPKKKNSLRHHLT